LRGLTPDDDILVVLTPSSLLDDLVLKNAFLHKKIIQISLAESMNLKTFVLPLKKHLSSVLGLPTDDDTAITEFTAEQKGDYLQYRYLCHDRLHIPGETTDKGKNIVKLNNAEVTIEEANFLVLLRFVVELKNNKEGWVSRSTVYEDGIIPDPNMSQHFSRLRRELEVSLIDGDGMKFIQNMRQKGYRISTHPDFVTYDKRKLLKHESNRIVEIAERLL